VDGHYRPPDADLRTAATGGAHTVYVPGVRGSLSCPALGGAIGGGLGGAAWAVNRALAHKRIPGPLKAALMLGVTALAMVLTLVAAGALRVLMASRSA
jgi:hypothetical protein